jgi:hypothetical protein
MSDHDDLFRHLSRVHEAPSSNMASVPFKELDRFHDEIHADPNHTHHAHVGRLPAPDERPAREEARTAVRNVLYEGRQPSGVPAYVVADAASDVWEPMVSKIGGVLADALADVDGWKQAATDIIMDERYNPVVAIYDTETKTFVEEESPDQQTPPPKSLREHMAVAMRKIYDSPLYLADSGINKIVDALMPVVQPLDAGAIALVIERAYLDWRAEDHPADYVEEMSFGQFAEVRLAQAQEAKRRST